MKDKKAKAKEGTEEESGVELCPKCGSQLVDEEGQKICPDCDAEIDYFGDKEE